MRDVLIRESNIEGKGVFAARNFKEGEAVLSIDDSRVVFDVDTLTSYQRQYECDWLEDGKIVLMKAPEKHINHSCNPNTYVKTIDGMRTVLAMRDIRQGEEVTYDYAINGFYDSDEPCHCGGKNCRKKISPNFFKLPREIQIKYLPYLDDWFVKRFSKEIENGKFGK